MFILTASTTLFGAPAGYAQLPERVDQCLPYPTYAQEVAAMRSSQEPEDTAPDKTFVIDSVEFDGPITLPEPARQKLIDDLKTRVFDGMPSRPRLDEIAEVGIRGPWQNEGYFKASASVTARDLGGDAYREHVTLVVHVDEGLRYLLGRIAFRSSDDDQPLVIGEAQLRNMFPLKEGDIFSADKIRESFETFLKLYTTRGYADFTAEPEFDVDDVRQRINLTLVFDQQKQFHIKDVQVDHLNPKTEGILRATFKPGDIFDKDALQHFFDENKSTLPPDSSIRRNVDMLRNIADGAVSMRFDFFTCPDGQQLAGFMTSARHPDSK